MKKAIIIIVIIIIIGGIIFAAVQKGKNKIEYLTAVVERADVIQTVDATGSVKSAEAIELNFRTTGRIESVSVAKGDAVKAGQGLARLESGALQSRMLDADSALAEAKANLEEVMAGATADDIRVAEVTVEQKQQDLLSQQDDLANLKLKSATEIKNFRDTIVVALGNELTVAKNALVTIEDTLSDEDAKNTLGALDSSAVPTAEYNQLLARQVTDDADIYLSLITTSSIDEEVSAALKVVNEALDKTANCLDKTMDVLEATIVSTDLSEAELDALVGNISAEQTAIAAAKTTLQTDESNWTNKQAYYTEQISKAENAVKAAEDSLELAEAQLTLKKAGPEDYQVNAAKARITKAEASLALAKANLADAIITAPVDGVIMEINNKPGEQTSLTNAVIEMIGETALEVEVDISESDITKIRIGQMAEITLDSYGDDVVFSGSVTFIDPAETVIQDVVYYQVKVQFDGLKEINTIKPGMTANVVIETSKKIGVLRMPIKAVNQKNGNKMVQVLDTNGQIEEKTVETGLKGDEYVEIMNGVSEGEKVVTFVKNNK